MRTINVTFTQYELGRMLFAKSAIKAKLLRAGVPVTEVTETSIEVSHGKVRWEYVSNARMLHVCWGCDKEPYESPDNA